MFRLFRVPNLLILLANQVLLSYGYIYPVFHFNKISPTFTSSEFFGILLVALALTAGGYVHNNLVDVKVDQLNQKSNPIGKGISRIQATWIFVFLSLLPIPFVHLMAAKMGHQVWAIVYYSTWLLIFVYNLYLKTLPLVGNVLVSLLCGASMIIIYLAEYQSFNELILSNRSHFELSIFVIGFWAILAYLVTLIREIVKDMEDVKGDAMEGHLTWAIVLPFGKLKAVIYVLFAVLFTSLISVLLFFLGSPVWYIGIVLMFAPLLWSGFQFSKASGINDSSVFRQVSKSLKLSMVFALFFLMALCYFAPWN